MNFETSAMAIRVFYGFKNASLPVPKFLQVVGRTFMPGTPYMLRDLGLASYTSGVLVGVAPFIPDEFALIGYASPETYHDASSATLQGRMYGQTHGGVYDLSRSQAAFPVDLAHLPPAATDPFFTWGEYADWQSGRVAVFVGQAIDDLAGAAFRAETRQAISTMKPVANDCLICLPSDRYVIVWAHSPDPSVGQPDWTPLSTIAAPVLSTTARRVSWKASEPPGQDFTKSDTISWVFVRESRFFLK